MRNNFLNYVVELRSWLGWAPAPLASALVLILTGLVALLASRLLVLPVGRGATLAIGISADLYLNRFKTGEEDNLLARKHVTQIRILKRAVDILVFVPAILSP